MKVLRYIPALNGSKFNALLEALLTNRHLQHLTFTELIDYMAESEDKEM